jgi:serine/threonine protein kinase
MIAFAGDVKLTDFGIAKARGFCKTTKGEVVAGKADYMSPEQADFQITDKRSDIFSTGVVLANLLAGLQHLQRRQRRGIARAHHDLPLPNFCQLNPRIDARLNEILHRTLARDLSKRYATADELLYELEYYIYHKGYGPTNETLGKFIRELFGQTVPRARPRTKGETTVLGARYALQAHRLIEDPPFQQVGNRDGRARIDSNPCSPDPAENFARAAEKISQAAGRGRDHLHPGTFHAPQYFARARTTTISNWPSPFPARPPRPCKSWPAATAPSSSPRFLKSARPAFITTPPPSLTPDGIVAGHLPQDAHSGRPALLREILLYSGRPGFSRLATRYGQDRRLHLLGPMVSRSRPADRPAGGEILFTRRPSAGIRRKKRSTASISTPPGKSCSAATPWPTAVSSPPSIASAWKNRRAARALNFGAELRGRTFRPNPGPRQRRPGGNPPRAGGFGAGRCRPARTGPSCATAASTPTATLTKRFID